MPAPPEQSEPAMVSATGIVVALPAGVSSCRVMAMCCPSAARYCQQVVEGYIEPQRDAPGDDSDGAFLCPVQMQARPVLCRRQRARRGRNCLRDLFDRGRL